MPSIAKRLGEDRFFSGAFVVSCHIFVIFCAFCLVVKNYFVNLWRKSRQQNCRAEENLMIDLENKLYEKVDF